VTGVRRHLAVTGWSVHLPGVRTGDALRAWLGTAVGAWADEPHPPAERAATVLGRKGLLAKEPATRLALCAVHRALRLPLGARPPHPVDPGTAVVACANLNNVETVARVVRTVRADGVGAVSVLDAPNVSSNVLAGTVALWFGFGGPNLMVCSGEGAGPDGLWLASVLLWAGRARRVVLVGAEPADEVARALYAGGDTGHPLRAAAACVVLEAAGRANGAAPVLLSRVPGGAPWPRPPRLVVGPDGFDPAAQWGDCHGARGVLGLALAAHLVADEGFDAVGVRDGRTGTAGGALVTGVLT
jgi:hypothetical protein